MFQKVIVQGVRTVLIQSVKLSSSILLFDVVFMNSFHSGKKLEDMDLDELDELEDEEDERVLLEYRFE